MIKNRKPRKSEVLKEAMASEELHSFMYQMSPHQLELLAMIASKIVSGKPVNK